MPVLLIVAAGPCAAQTVPVTDDEAIQQFQQAADEYVLMHRYLERQLPSVKVTADTETLRQAIAAMAAAIRMARSEAKQGDLFSPAVAEVLRYRIARSLQRRGLTPFDVRADQLADTGPVGMPVLTVNGSFPWKLAAGMNPAVLQALPPLPPELQYRMIDSDLVLIDVHAGVIVDILPYALAYSEDVRLEGPGS
jgi:hypothetical protein